MVATLLRLRLRILRHTLRREVWRVVVLVVGVLWALATLPSVVGGMVWLAGQDAEVALDVLVVAGAVLVVGWTVVPVLVPGLDDSLDIGRFATLGVPVTRLVPGLLAASLLGVPTLFTGLVCLAPVIAWWGVGGPLAGVTAVVAAPLAWATCVLASRLSTSLVGLLLGSRRSRELTTVIGLLVAALAVPVVLAVGALGLEGALERLPTIVGVLSWTPVGLAWAAPGAVAAGDLLGGAVRLVLAAAVVVGALVGWSALLHRALVRPPSRGGQVRRRVDAVLPRHAGAERRTGTGRTGAGPTETGSRTGAGPTESGRRAGPRPAAAPGALAARAILRRGLRSWSADPRYTSSLLGAVVAPVVVVLLAATVVDAPAAVALSMGPLMAGSIGWGRHNDVAYDGTALWMHVTAAVPGWADRLGRMLATLVWAAPLTAAVGVLGALIGGRPDLAVAAVGAGLGVLCAGLAVSAVVSALLPYPVPEPGGNPFSAEMGAVGASLGAQVLASAATLALSGPVLVAFAAAMWRAPGYGVLALAVGVLGGVLVTVGGVLVGGRVYDARSRRLLARLA